MKKRWFALILAVALLCTAIGCSSGKTETTSGGSSSSGSASSGSSSSGSASSGSSSSGSASSGSATSGGSSAAVKTDLVYCLTGDPANLDPTKTTDQMSCAVWNQLYDTLGRKLPDGTYEARVAESWEISEDGMKVTFHLRDDVLFHDGSKLTADDVVFTIERDCTSPSTSGGMTCMAPGCAKAIDDKTVEVNLTAPFGGILDVIFMEVRILPKAVVESVGDEAFALNPIGCGTYKFVERQTGEKIVLTAFDKHYKDNPPIKDITFKIITDSATAAVALEKGEVDFLSHAPLTARTSLMNNPKLTWYETPIAGLIYLVFNCEEGIFADPRVRQAMACGIDKEVLVIGGVEGNGEPISSMIPQACNGYVADFPDVPYDVEKAKQLLAEAGYPNGFSIVLKTQENATYSKPTQALQGELANLGINAEINMMERGAFFSEYATSNYDMMIMHWTTPSMDADFLWQLCHSSQLGAGNKNKINDPDLDAALEKGRYSLSQEERLEGYRAVNQIIQDNAYFVPLYTFMAPCCCNKDLKNVQANSLYKFYVRDWTW